MKTTIIKGKRYIIRKGFCSDCILWHTQLGECYREDYCSKEIGAFNILIEDTFINRLRTHLNL